MTNFIRPWTEKNKKYENYATPLMQINNNYTNMDFYGILMYNFEL